MDTATKRQSALSFNQVYMPLNQTDGTIDQGDRQAVSFAYSGVLTVSPTSTAGNQYVYNWDWFNDQVV